jgi:hypothetical protein
VGNSYDLNFVFRPLVVDQGEREPPQQESPRRMWAFGPTSWCGDDLRQCAIYFRIESDGAFGTALQVSVKRRIIFGPGFGMKLG